MLIVCSYGILKFNHVIFYEQPSFIKNTVLRNMYEEFPDPFNATENNFEIAIGFLSIRPFEY